MRDTLQIEVDPTTISFSELKDLFRDQEKCRTLYSYTEAVDESTDKTILVRNTVGEAYSIFVSISDEERLVTHQPGLMLPDEIEELYTVTIAQMTYQEYAAAYPNSVKEE
ncbi:MAG: hypothetical protein NC131_11310 [Roseburia sp.]|nr:hypothetical protein [Roseburia sp.]